jgi:hypothetical protein
MPALPVRTQKWMFSSFTDEGSTGRSRHLTPEDITREIQRRRDSHEDLDAQQGTYSIIPPSPLTFSPPVLGTMQGDSLAKANVQGYLRLLRASGAFGIDIDGPP